MTKCKYRLVFLRKVECYRKMYQQKNVISDLHDQVTELTKMLNFAEMQITATEYGDK